MTDPLSPAEAAAADAIDAENAKHANDDLVGGTEVPAALRDPMAIPHAQHIVPAAQEHHAGDPPVHHADKPHILPSSPAPAPAKVSTPSALLAEKLAAAPSGKPVKRKYAYQRNRK